MSNRHSGKGLVLALGCILAPAVSLWSDGTQAALYLKFDGIDGESTEIHHEKWSVIDQVTFAVSATTGATGRDLSLTFEDLAWSQVMDKSYPKLFSAIVHGDQLNTAKIDFTVSSQGSELVYFNMTFKDVTLTSLNLTGGGIAAIVKGAFSYSQIDMTYTTFDSRGKPSGTSTASYDLKKGGAKEAAALFALYEVGIAGPAAPVPEPQSWAMFALGLGVLGWRLRARAR